MEFTPVHFIPAVEKDLILSLPVYSIRAAGQFPNANTNHWCFYLVTGPNTSVRIDCTPSYSVPSTVSHGGSKANLIISRLPYNLSGQIVKSFDLTCRANLTVGDVCNVLIQNGRHKYEFDINSVGCRYWISNQLDLFAETGIIVNSEEVTAAKAGILYFWPDESPLSLDQGAYYQ